MNQAPEHSPGAIAREVLHEVMQRPEVLRSCYKAFSGMLSLSDVCEILDQKEKWVKARIGHNTDARPPQIPMVKLPNERGEVTKTSPWVISREAFDRWFRKWYAYVESIN